MSDTSMIWGARTYVMGIINVTPDSFSGDGIWKTRDVIKTALKQAEKFISAGVDILDIGGESTRPGSEPVSIQQEIDRVIPVIEAIRKQREITISVDTSKAVVASSALAAGAKWINDVWGFRADPEIGSVAAKADCKVILMHNRSKPNEIALQERLGGMYLGADYKNLLEDVKRELLESVQIATRAGVKKEQIILDPGIGFGKTVRQNLDLIDRLGEIRQLGYPVLLGPSRKSFIGYTLDVPPDQRLEGTLAAISVGIVRGVDIIRAHDVLAAIRVAKMTDAIVRRS